MDGINRVLMITGGTCDIGFCRSFLENQKFNKIIAIDSGMTTAWKLDLQADYLVGDFDSVPEDSLKQYKEYLLKRGKDVVIRPYNPEKDYTDTHIAMELAVSLKADEVVILGGTGSRFDHMLGNLNILLIGLEAGIKACIIDKNNKIYLTNTDMYIKKGEQYGKYVSLIPFGGEAIVTLKGFKYPLDQYTMKVGQTIGISNEILEETAFIGLEKGIVVVTEAND